MSDASREADRLVRAAGRRPGLLGAEGARAEQPVARRLQGPVVDGLRLLHLAVRPGPDSLRRGQPDLYCVKVVDILHVSLRLRELETPTVVIASPKGEAISLPEIATALRASR